MENFILGIIAGMVLLIILIFVVGEWSEKIMRKKIGEDIVYVRMKKSEMEEFNKIYKEVNKTVDVRAKDGSYESTYTIDKE